MLTRWLLLMMGLVLVVTGSAAAGSTAVGSAGGSSPVADRAHDTEPGARVVDRRRIGERLLELGVRSPAMGGRIMTVRLLTPVGWDGAVDDGRHWSSLWLLHGCCGDQQGWSRNVDLASIPELRSTLVVMPDGGWNGWYSDWWDGGRPGDQRWETFHLSELRPLLEREYGADDRRVIAGLSMGGQGALGYAARHRSLFAAVAAYSGTVHPLQSARTVAWRQSRFAALGDDPDRVWGDPVAQRRLWEAHDPWHLADRLTGLPVYLSCGDGTVGPYDPAGRADPIETALITQNRALATELRRRGATRLVTHFYGAGQHRWAYWDREFRASLPLLLGALRTAA